MMQLKTRDSGCMVPGWELFLGLQEGPVEERMCVDTYTYCHSFIKLHL